MDKYYQLTPKSQSELFHNLSKKERKVLKRQLEHETQKNNARNRFLKRIAIISVIIAVVGFVIWWGVTKSNQQATVVASSNVGAQAPNFSLPATTGKTITLADYKDKKNVMIYFHEGLSCDPCIQQIPELQKRLPEFEKMNIEVLAVAYDQVDKQKETAQRLSITIPMLSYYNASTENDYNLTPFSMAMGRRAGHTFVLVDKSGKIIWRKDYWPGHGMSVSNGKMFVDAQEIVDNVKTVLNK